MIAPRMRVSGKGLLKRNRQIMQEVPRAAEEAAKFAARAGAAWIIASSPRDTNRFIAGWQQAVNASGIGTVQVLKIAPGKFIKSADVVGRMRRQLAIWKRTAEIEAEARNYWHTIFENRYNRVGRRGRWRDDAMRKMKAAEWRAKRAAEIVRRIEEAVLTLKNDPSAVVIFGKKSKARGMLIASPGVSGDAAADARFARRLERAAFALGQVGRVISKVYGGGGSVNRDGSRVWVTLIHYEPHAHIVNRKHRLVQRSMAVARRGGKLAGAQFVKRIGRARG